MALRRHHFVPGNTLLVLLAAAFTAHANEELASPEAEDKFAAPSPTITFSPYEFSSRDGQKVTVERGEFYVPENRSDPKSRRIQLGFVRFPATTGNKSPPLVYLAGGPGGSGVEAAQLPARFAIFMALRDVGDVIAFDQRGTGWSNDIPECPRSPDLPLDKPTTRASLVAALQSAARVCVRFWKDAGIDLAGYNTVESADDVEALRQALGAQKISLWGISYGSHLAFAILKRHPNSIERVALVGLEGLDETVKLPALTDAFIARLQATIDRDPAAAKAYPDLAGTMRKLHAQLDKQPVSVPFRDSSGKDVILVLGSLDLQALAAFSISDPSRSRRLPELYTRMAAGDFSQAAPFVYDFIRKPGAIRFRGMPEAMDAASGISADRLRLVEQHARTSLLGDILNFPIPHAGDAFGVPDLGDRFREPVSSSVPTLFLSGTLDGRTYPESAREIAARFANGTHIIVENGGHNLFEASPLIRDMIVAYMKGQEPVSTTLTLDPPKFVE